MFQYHMNKHHTSNHFFRFYIDGREVVAIPGGQKIDEYPVGDCFLGFYEFGKYWSDSSVNVWNEKYHDYLMAPFDQEVKRESGLV